MGPRKWWKNECTRSDWSNTEFRGFIDTDVLQVTNKFDTKDLLEFQICYEGSDLDAEQVEHLVTVLTEALRELKDR